MGSRGLARVLQRDQIDAWWMDGQRGPTLIERIYFYIYFIFNFILFIYTVATHHAHTVGSSRAGSAQDFFCV